MYTYAAIAINTQATTADKAYKDEIDTLQKPFPTYNEERVDFCTLALSAGEQNPSTHGGGVLCPKAASFQANLQRQERVKSGCKLQNGRTRMRCEKE